MGRKLGGVPLRGEGGGSPSSTMARADPYLRAKFHLDPSNRLATVHQRRSPDRQTGLAGQRPESIGEPFLTRDAAMLAHSWES